jgi:hypothetical protein
MGWVVEGWDGKGLGLGNGERETGIRSKLKVFPATLQSIIIASLVVVLLPQARLTSSFVTRHSLPQVDVSYLLINRNLHRFFPEN